LRCNSNALRAIPCSALEQGIVVAITGNAPPEQGISYPQVGGLRRGLMRGAALFGAKYTRGYSHNGMTFIASKQINSITIVLFSQCKSDKIDKPNPTGQNLLGQNLFLVTKLGSSRRVCRFGNSCGVFAKPHYIDVRVDAVYTAGLTTARGRRPRRPHK
jgi:hypothetical protein